MADEDKNNEDKNNDQLIAELAQMRQRLDEQAESLQDQTERARRQLAAERIRAEVMAMRSSNDLYPLAATFLSEVRNLGINTWFLSIAFIEEGEITHYYRAIVNWS